MNDGLIPRRYAKALYKLATETGEAQQIYEQIKIMDLSYSAIDRFKKVLLNPYVPAADKGDLMLKAVGAEPGGSLEKFFLLVFNNNRADYLRKIALSYVKLYREKHDIAKVEIVMAQQMPQSQIDAIVDIVKKQLGNMTLEVSQTIDPGIIGGFIVVIDSLVLDASIKRELQNMRLKLLSSKQS